MEVVCKNCDAVIAADCDYCPRCSQKVNLHRLSMHDVFHEGLHYFTHADKGLFQLLRDLVVKRGIVAREFVDGRRKKYFSPLSFFLLVAATYVFIFSLQSVPDAVGLNPALHPMQLRYIKVMHFFNKYSNFIAMLALPLTAFFFWLFYRKAGFNYTEHLVACMYMIGFILLCHAIVILPTVKVLDVGSNVGIYTLSVFQVFYSAIFYYRFIDNQTHFGKFKAFGVSLATTVIWFALSGFVVRFYIMNGFWGLLP